MNRNDWYENQLQNKIHYKQVYQNYKNYKNNMHCNNYLLSHFQEPSSA